MRRPKHINPALVCYLTIKLKSMATKNASSKKLDRRERKILLRKTKISEKKTLASRKVGRRDNLSLIKQPENVQEDDLDLLEGSHNMWGEDYSLVEKRNGKCVVSFPIYDRCPSHVDGDLGLISVIMLKGIYYTDFNTKNQEVIYEFPKQYMKKIKAIEKAYFAHKIKIDAKSVTESTVLHANIYWPKNTKHNL